MEIVDNKGAPPELVRIVHEAAEDCEEIQKVIFDAFIPELKGDMGAFNPDTGTIIIDMGACIVNKAWRKKGIMFIPCVWFNLVMTLYHEVAHAIQLETEPELKKLDVLPQRYEDDATEYGEWRLREWVLEHPIPSLAEMGWVGEQLKLLLNKLYTKMPEAVIEEVDLQGTEIAARAEDAARASKEYSTEEETALLLQQIGEGMVGAMVGDRKYLTAYEAIDLDHFEHYNNRR